MPRLGACARGTPRPGAAAPVSTAAASSPSRLPGGTLQSLNVTSPQVPCCQALSCARMLRPGVSAGTSSTLALGRPLIIRAEPRIGARLAAGEGEMIAVAAHELRQQGIALRIVHALIEQHM